MSRLSTEYSEKRTLFGTLGVPNSKFRSALTETGISGVVLDVAGGAVLV